MRIPEPETHRGFSSLSPEHKNLITVQRQVAHAREQGTLGNCLHELIMLGLWDDVAEIDADLAAELKAAIEKDDNERCDCEHTVERFKEKAGGEIVWTGVMEPAKKYQTAYKVWSEKHGGLVPVYRCALCGHLNAFHGDPDETHQKINEQRATMDKTTENQLKRWQVR